MRSFLSILVFGVVSLAMTEKAGADSQYDQEISHCSKQFPSLIYDYLLRSSCIDEADKALALRELERKLEAKEDAARPCIATQLPNLDQKLRNLSANVEIRPPKSIVEAMASIENYLGVKGEVVIPDDLILEKTVVAFVRPTCETEFGYLVNIRLDKDQRTRWLSVYAQNPPKGLSGVGIGGYVESFSIDIEERERQNQIAAELALQEKRIKDEEAERKALTDWVLANSTLKVKRIDCYYGRCYDYSVTMDLANGSDKTIEAAEFAIFTLGPDQLNCRWQNSGNVKMQYLNLLPYETREITVRSGSMGVKNGPSSGDVRVCAQLVSIKLGG
jgi:hypothetical protein